MTTFKLFDQVKLIESVSLTGFMSNAQLESAAIGTVGTIVEVLEPDKAFLVELFGNWVTVGDAGDFCMAKAGDFGAFRETIGVDTVYPHQMTLVNPSSTDRLSLFQLLDEMPEN